MTRMSPILQGILYVCVCVGDTGKGESSIHVIFGLRQSISSTFHGKKW